MSVSRYISLRFIMLLLLVIAILAGCKASDMRPTKNSISFSHLVEDGELDDNSTFFHQALTAPCATP